MKPREILREAEHLLDDTVQLRRRIHRHPELGLTLPRAQAAVPHTAQRGALATGVAMHAAVALGFLERKGALG